MFSQSPCAPCPCRCFTERYEVIRCRDKKKQCHTTTISIWRQEGVSLLCPCLFFQTLTLVKGVCPCACAACPAVKTFSAIRRRRNHAEKQWKGINSNINIVINRTPLPNSMIRCFSEWVRRRTPAEFLRQGRRRRRKGKRRQAAVARE
jgi:hypothetical protein